MNKEILNFESSKKAMANFTDYEKALLMMDMTQNLFEAHKMRHDAELRVQQLEDALGDISESLGFYAALDCWESGEIDDGKTSIAWRDCESLTYVENDDESPSTEIFGGKRAREALYRNKEILDTINKRGEE